MKTRNIRVIAGLIVILGLFSAHMAFAQDMVIDSATPSSAEQDTYGLDVTISGTGFDNSIEEVKFLLPCTPEPCTGAGGRVTTRNFKVRGSKKIVATIDIAEDAIVADYDIAVTRSRGGKGTTFKGLSKFTVKSRGNQSHVDCSVFAPSGTCNCQFFLLRDSGDSGTPPVDIYTLIEDCETAETLRIPQFSNISSEGAVQGGGSERKTITAVNLSDGEGGDLPFDGDVIIENEGHRAVVRDINLALAPDVEAGCDGGIHTALRFRLDSESPDPTALDPAYLHTHWRIQSIHVETDPLGEPLCRGIDLWREDSYTETYDILGAYDARIFVAGGWIKPGSFTETAIRFGGFKWKSDAHNPPEVIGVQVDRQADGATDAVAIEFGDISNSDTSAPYHGLIAENVINLSGNGTGILAFGEADGNDIEDNLFRIDKNTISGADLGIYVDESVNEVNFSGNTLTGDGENGSGDIPICSLAQSTGGKGKPNRINDFDSDEIQTVDCP